MLINKMHEGDVITLNFDLEGENLPSNADISFVIEVDKDNLIKKKVGLDGVVKLTEDDTVGLKGVYKFELRVNNKDIAKVLCQDYIEITNSITVGGNFVSKEEFIDVSKFDERLTKVEESTGVVDMSGYIKSNEIDNLLDEKISNLNITDGKDGKDGIDGQNGLQGERGEKGQNGRDGKNGKSAYQLATQNGFTGTLNEWLLSLKGNSGVDGSSGLSAYDIAVENGFNGTKDDWLESLRGQDGIDGVDGTNGIDGNNGADGIDGQDGLSAYQIAVNNGYDGAENEWLESLKGIDGKNGKDGRNAERVLLTSSPNWKLNNTLTNINQVTLLKPTENLSNSNVPLRLDSNGNLICLANMRLEISFVMKDVYNGFGVSIRRASNNEIIRAAMVCDYAKPDVYIMFGGTFTTPPIEVHQGEQLQIFYKNLMNSNRTATSVRVNDVIIKIYDIM